MPGTDRMRRLRLVLWSLVGVAIFGIGAWWAGREYVPPRTENITPGEAAYAKPFSLLNYDGQIVTEADFLGKPSAWFFGFTHCPDVCPTALADMTLLLKELGPDADKIRVVFVTVDPARDTPEVMKAYVEYFDKRIIGLSGDEASVARMARDRYIHFERVPGSDDNYDMEHTAGIQLVSADGRFAGTLDGHEDMKVRLAKIRRLME